jgi:hypothetical protein
MLRLLYDQLATRRISLRVIGARGRVRDLLRADGVGEIVGGLDRLVTLENVLNEYSERGRPSQA